MVASIDFWEGFFLMLIWIPVVMLWIFTLMDIFRREDLSGWSMALWVLFVILLPLIGMLVYFIVRPVTAQDLRERDEMLREIEYAKTADAADKLAKLSDLKEKGHISQEEFDALKAKLMSD